jgi:hypothetical protein
MRQTSRLLGVFTFTWSGLGTTLIFFQVIYNHYVHNEIDAGRKSLSSPDPGEICVPGDKFPLHHTKNVYEIIRQITYKLTHKSVYKICHHRVHSTLQSQPAFVRTILQAVTPPLCSRFGLPGPAAIRGSVLALASPLMEGWRNGYNGIK